MVKCVVVADDMTGATATGVMLKKMNYNTTTLLSINDLNIESLTKSDCITLTTNSRGIDAENAYNRVYNVTKMCLSDQVVFYSKRIDSTVRGNLGAETDAMLDVLGEDHIAIVVPCAPASGRVTVGGHMLVKGVILNKTEAAVDPKTPIRDSRVIELFKKQTKYKIASIYMEDLNDGEEYVSNLIRQKVRNGARIIICDSVTEEDIDMVADAAIDSGIPFITVDPGALTAAVLRKKVKLERQSAHKILAVVGSVNPVARRQLDYLWLSQPVYNAMIHTEEFLKGEAASNMEIDRVTGDILSKINDYEIFSITSDGIEPDKKLDLALLSTNLGITIDEISDKINNAFAEVTYQLLKMEPEIGGLYTSGGDITTAVCKRIHALGIELIDEVVPLAACGKLLRGEFPGKWIVTKGGMTGNQDAISLCIGKLKANMNL